LARERRENQQIILITDGEPTTATMDGGGRLHGGWSSLRLNRKIVEETLKEVHRCTQKGILINTFMVGYSPYPQGFVQRMAEVNRGRVFVTQAEQVGEYLLLDYLAKKKKWVRG
jgi:Ca-activated chloride channel family protein